MHPKYIYILPIQIPFQNIKEENSENTEKLKKCFASYGDRFKLIGGKVNELSILEDDVCMLDMRGQKELEIGAQWKTIVFGGILGDHPPRDRPATLRKNFKTLEIQVMNNQQQIQLSQSQGLS